MPSFRIIWNSVTVLNFKGTTIKLRVTAVSPLIFDQSEASRAYEYS